MVVDRRHFEDPFAREFEGEHLKDDGDALDYPDKRYRDEKKFAVCQHYETDDEAADEEGAGVAHKYLGGVEVEYQKRKQRARESGGGSGENEGIILHSEEHKGYTDKERDAARETVDTVGKVGAVDYIGYREKHYDIIEYSEVDGGAPREIYDRIVSAEVGVAEEICADGSELENKLLGGGETFVALFEKLYVVVDEADKPRKEGETESGQKLYQFVGLEVFFTENKLEGDGAREGNEEEETAEVGSSLFAFMPRRAYLEDFLPEFYFSKHGDKDFIEDYTDYQGNKSAERAEKTDVHL